MIDVVEKLSRHALSEHSGGAKIVLVRRKTCNITDDAGQSDTLDFVGELDGVTGSLASNEQAVRKGSPEIRFAGPIKLLDFRKPLVFDESQSQVIARLGLLRINRQIVDELSCGLGAAEAVEIDKKLEPPTHFLLEAERLVEETVELAKAPESQNVAFLLTDERLMVLSGAIHEMLHDNEAVHRVHAHFFVRLIERAEGRKPAHETPKGLVVKLGERGFSGLKQRRERGERSSIHGCGHHR